MQDRLEPVRRGAVLGGCAALGTWAAVLWVTHGTAAAEKASHLGLAFLVALAAVTCIRRSLRHRGQERRLWFLLAVAVVGWGAATASTRWRGWFTDFAGGNALPAETLVPALVAVLAGVGAIVPLLSSHHSVVENIRDGLDHVLFTGVTAALVWCLVLAPLPRSAAVGPLASLQALLLLAELMVLVASVTTAVRSRGLYPGLGWVALAAVFFITADLWSAVASAPGVRHAGDAPQWGQAIALALLTVGARWSTKAHPVPARRGTFMRKSAFPTAAVLLLVVLSLPRLVQGGPEAAVESWLRTVVLVALVARTLLALLDADGLTRGLEERIAERTAELQASREWFASLVAHGSDLVVVMDADGVVTYAGPSVEQLLGRSVPEMLGSRAVDLVTPTERAVVLSAWTTLLSGGAAPRQMRTTMLHSAGHTVVLQATLTDLLDDPVVHGVVINAHDITDAVRLEGELNRLAFSDALTGLPNRALFCDRLEQALRNRTGHVKICYLDLDGFKAVNDTLGHGAGDALLRVVAERLRTTVRQGDTVARLGGDEFAVLLEEGASLEEARQLARRICDTLRRPYDVRGSQVHVAASVGLATTREVGRDGERLMRSADLAMYQAKRQGRGGYAVYHPDMHDALVERVTLETDLRGAVERGEFVVVYQPLVDMSDDSICGVEALVRWHHPQRGVVSPAEFIPLAEATGLIHKIGLHVLDEACRQVSIWRTETPAAEGMRLSVNLSGHQIRDPELVRCVNNVLLDRGFPATSLVLEVTESTLVEQDEFAMHTLNSLRSLGIRLAIDDFGTGYSSLSYLHRLPVDILKIDKSFVDRLSSDGDLSLVDAILSIAAAFDLGTVAEGIEHEHQKKALAAQGCGTGQGYYFSPPVNAAAIPALISGPLPPRAESAGATPQDAQGLTLSGRSLLGP